MTSHEFTIPRGRDDAGIAMVMTMALVVFSTAMALTMIAYVMGESRLTGQQRQRGTAISAAEGQVDTMIHRITSATTLPCSPGNVTDSASPPDTITVATTVTYYNAAGAALACPVPAGVTPDTVPATGLVRAVATSQRLDGTRPARRVIESLVRLTAPVYGTSLTKAIFGASSVTLGQNTDINGTNPSTSNADIYTSGDFSCANNQDLHGSVIAQGGITMANSCVIYGQAWSRTGFTANSPSNTVGGSVRVSAGNADLPKNATVIGDVQVSGTISWPSGCTPSSKCTSGAAVAAPPAEPFPQISWDATTQQAWITNGYTIVTNNDCASGTNDPGHWLINQGPTLTTPTILRTSCALEFPANTTLRLNADLAVFADGAITLSKVDVQSTNATVRNLYFIQPFNTPCGTDPGISLDNQVTFDAATVKAMLYTPCSLRKSNLSALIGQMYSGSSVIIGNQTNLIYSPLPIFGVTNGAGGGQTWKPDLLSKRENT